MLCWTMSNHAKAVTRDSHLAPLLIVKSGHTVRSGASARNCAEAVVYLRRCSCLLRLYSCVAGVEDRAQQGNGLRS